MSYFDEIDGWQASPFGGLDLPPWIITQSLVKVVAIIVENLPHAFEMTAPGVAVHRSSEVETGALIKPPAVIGPACFIASGSLLRGGVWLDSKVIVGPGAELKTSIVFAGSKLAHFNFVGDSILGSDVNLEAGSIIANYRNEQADPQIMIAGVPTGVTKFGALVGDGCRIGANAVVAPGALIPARTIIPRLGLVDQN